MRKPMVVQVLVVLALWFASWALFAGVLNTGFWSPEDLHELKKAAQIHTEGSLIRSLRPALAGGYRVNPIFAMEFELFGMNPRPYYIVNLVVHIFNSYLAFLLVQALLHDRRSSFMAALLFALSVGSYGKNLMFASGISSLFYAMACLLGTLLYIQNEKKNAGRAWGPYAVGFFVIFLASLFMRGGTFSILASFGFYNIFFRHERRRPVLHTNLVICLVAVAVALFARVALPGQDAVSRAVDPGVFLRNLPGYLILMVFPLHQSAMLEGAPALVRGVYNLAPYIRVLAGLTIFSYSFFGFVFGNRAIRFYIAWMYVMVVPFAVFRYPSDWLNLRFLYLVSLGFCVLLTSGTLYTYRLLAHRGAQRFVPFVIPVVYVVLSAALVGQLDRKNDILARQPGSVEMRARIQSILQSSSGPPEDPQSSDPIGTRP